jgi:hypothetical protein
MVPVRKLAFEENAKLGAEVGLNFTQDGTQVFLGFGLNGFCRQDRTVILQIITDTLLVPRHFVGSSLMI